MNMIEDRDMFEKITIRTWLLTGQMYFEIKLLSLCHLRRQQY